MSHFWMQFSSDVAVLGRRCQFEILIVPESFQKDWHFVDHHLVDLWGLCCFFRRELLSWTEIWEFRNVFWFTVEGSCWSVDQLGEILLSYFSKKISHRNQWKVMHLTCPAGMFGKTQHGRRAQCEWSRDCSNFAQIGLQTKHKVNKMHHREI